MVEHEAGPRYPKRVRALTEIEQIELHIFSDEFIRPGREIANVVAGVEDDADLNKLSSNGEESRHGPGRGKLKRFRERPFFLTSDGDRAITYGVRAYA